MRNRLKIIPALLLGGFLMAAINTSEVCAQDQHALLTEILKEYVVEGDVDYKRLKEDDRFDQYIQQLTDTNPENLSSREEKMAFWINAYNVYTLKIICDNYPIKSISELHSGGLVLGTVFKRTVWHKKLVVINNERTSLDHIEHKILRPVFEDARIHFAIVCAAKSCPPLRSEAYEAERLNQQLDDQGRVFLAQKEKNAFDTQERIATISPIFKWFKRDFAKNYADLLVYLGQFLPDDIANDIKSNPRKWKIKYSYYDWSLNEQ